MGIGAEDDGRTDERTNERLTVGWFLFFREGRKEARKRR